MSAANDPRFGDVERQYAMLKAQLNDGQLTREQFEAGLQKLIILDDQRRYWMLGAESGKWYQYDGQQWVQTAPPTANAATPPPPPSDAEHAAVRADAMTMAAFAPPQVDQLAVTMPSFTPPQATPPIDRAATMPAFALPQTTAPAPTMPALPTSGGRRWSPMLVLGLLFLCACLLGAVGLAVAVAARFNNTPSVPTGAPILVTTATSTPASGTALTPSPSPAPTVAPTSPPSPTATPSPRPPIVLPATVAPTATPTNTPEPTATPIPPPPTDTPVPPPPTNTPVPPPPPTPTKPPAVEFQVSVSYRGYADWGRPDQNNCNLTNTKSKVRQLIYDVTVTNTSSKDITSDDWYVPQAYNNTGGPAIRNCFYQPPNIPTGQSGKATFEAYVELNQWVGRITFRIRNTTYVRCVDAAIKEVPC